MFLVCKNLHTGGQREFQKLLPHVALAVKMEVHVLKRCLKRQSHLAHKLKMPQKRRNTCMLKEKSQEEEENHQHGLPNQIVSQVQVLQLFTYWDRFA